MKRTVSVFILLLVSVVTLLGAFSVAHSAVSTAQEAALAFIENALPVDMTKYSATLTKYTDMNWTADIVQYTLESEESVLVVNCYVQDNILIGCNLEPKSGTVITDKPYASLNDAAIGFLEKYQTYTERDSTEMINILSNVDATKNSTVTAGNVKLTVTKHDAFGADMTGFYWTYTIDGVDYPLLNFGFRNGVFIGLVDKRGIYKIGDTAVKVSKEQAINSAMKYIEAYSYAMPGGSQVSGFNVTEERTVAELHSAVRDSSVLYPSWRVRLYLNQTYPGSVNAFVVGVWADSGEVFYCGHEGPGGSLPSNDKLDPASTLSPSENNSSVSSPDMRVVGAAVAIIAVAAVCAVLIKRRGK
jgi:hypothetical protein